MAEIPLFTVEEWVTAGAAGVRIAACRGCGAATEAGWKAFAAKHTETIDTVVARFACGACGQPGRDNDVYGFYSHASSADDSTPPPDPITGWRGRSFILPA